MFNIGLTVFGLGLLLQFFWKAGGFMLSLCAIGIWLAAVLLWARDCLRGVLLKAPAERADRHPPHSGLGVEEDRPLPLDDPEVPASVRELAQRDAQPGDVLWRCVRQGAPTGPLAVLGWGHRPLVLEWWLMSAEGELIEAYWLER